MRKILLLISVVMLLACQPECNDVKPLRQFVTGQKVIFKPSNEIVRVVDTYVRFGGRCRYNFGTGNYTIKFTDGAEITANWTVLKELNNDR